MSASRRPTQAPSPTEALSKTVATANTPSVTPKSAPESRAPVPSASALPYAPPRVAPMTVPSRSAGTKEIAAPAIAPFRIVRRWVAPSGPLGIIAGTSEVMGRLGSTGDPASDFKERVYYGGTFNGCVPAMAVGIAILSYLKEHPEIYVALNGTVSNSRIFHRYTGPERGVPDGMKCDVAGNVWCTAPGGIWVHDPSGKPIVRIKTPGHHATNIAFGDDDWKSLYITNIGSVIRTRVTCTDSPLALTLWRSNRRLNGFGVPL